MRLVILSVSLFINILLGLLVYLKAPRRHINRAFAGLVLSLIGLSLATYASLHVAAPLPFIRLTMLFAICLVTVFKWFSVWFPSEPFRFDTRRWLELSTACAVAIVMLSPITFSGVHIAANGNVQPSFGPGIAVFMAYFVYMVGTGLTRLVIRMRRTRGKERQCCFGHTQICQARLQAV